jgi:hypothetical protein
MLRNTVIASAVAIGAIAAGVTGAQACSNFGSSNCGATAVTWDDRDDRWFYGAPAEYDYGPGVTIYEED